MTLVATTVFAQSPSPWSVDLARDRADVTLNDVDAVWLTDRFQLGWMRPESGGWSATVERQERYDLVDVSFGARGYRRLGDWTLAAGAAATADADFLQRVAFDGEISRRLVGTIVASAGYRYLDFTSAEIHQLQPAITWYHAKGEVQTRVFVTRNVDANRTTSAVLVRSNLDVTPRFGFGLGAVYGHRVFDVASLPTASARTVLGFATARLGFTSRDNLVVGFSIGHEDPTFEYRSFTLGYRRTF